MRKACVTDAEYALWQQLNWSGATLCFDCTPEFHEAMRAQGSCDGEPGLRPGHKGARRRGRRGPAPFYATEGERRAARRETWRNSKRRAYARRRVA